MTFNQFKNSQMKKDLITFLTVIALLLCLGKVSAQSVPDTAVTIKTTNNQLYKLNALFSVASQQLLKSEMPVKDYIEFQKQYQAILQAWFKQKEYQMKVVKQPVKKE